MVTRESQNAWDLVPGFSLLLTKAKGKYPKQKTKKENIIYIYNKVLLREGVIGKKLSVFHVFFFLFLFGFSLLLLVISEPSFLSGECSKREKLKSLHTERERDLVGFWLF